MSEGSFKVTENKLFTFSAGAIFVIATSVIGFTLWLSAINEKAQANYLHIQDLKEDKDVQTEMLRNIDRRTAKMEGILEVYFKVENHKPEGE